MLPEEFANFVRTKPFRPYRIHLTDGRSHEVSHPDMAVIVGFDSIIVGVPKKELKKDSWEQEILVSLSQVTQIEFVD